jgi:hypothetical protein
MKEMLECGNAGMPKCALYRDGGRCYLLNLFLFSRRGAEAQRRKRQMSEVGGRRSDVRGRGTERQGSGVWSREADH